MHRLARGERLDCIRLLLGGQRFVHIEDLLWRFFIGEGRESTNRRAATITLSSRSWCNSSTISGFCVNTSVFNASCRTSGFAFASNTVVRSEARAVLSLKIAANRVAKTAHFIQLAVFQSPVRLSPPFRHRHLSPSTERVVQPPQHVAPQPFVGGRLPQEFHERHKAIFVLARQCRQPPGQECGTSGIFASLNNSNPCVASSAGSDSTPYQIIKLRYSSFAF